jgi:hypothetical protein
MIKLLAICVLTCCNQRKPAPMEPPSINSPARCRRAVDRCFPRAACWHSSAHCTARSARICWLVSKQNRANNWRAFLGLHRARQTMRSMYASRSIGLFFISSARKRRSRARHFIRFGWDLRGRNQRGYTRRSSWSTTFYLGVCCGGYQWNHRA